MSHVLNDLSPDTMLKECQAMEFLLLGDLSDLLEEQLDQENRPWLLAVLNALLAIERHEYELESRGGYLSEVIAEFPNWDSQVRQLEQERCLLQARLEELRDRIADDTARAVLVQRARDELRHWMNRLRAHQRHARRLVQMAYNLEIGGDG